jgi:hypothetical protein
MKLGPKEKRLLDWLERTEGRTLLESQVVASGLEKALVNLLLAGLADMDAHPTVKDRSGWPASAVMLRKPDDPSREGGE